jgi:hypothetical protein
MPQTSLGQTDKVVSAAGNCVEPLPRRIRIVPGVDYEPRTVRGPICDAQLQGWILYRKEPFARSISLHEEWEQTSVRRDRWGQQSVLAEGRATLPPRSRATAPGSPAASGGSVGPDDLGFESGVPANPLKGASRMPKFERELLRRTPSGNDMHGPVGSSRRAVPNQVG